MAKNTPAYEGNSPYIFISYAHNDSDSVFRVLEVLCSRGYRIWYDDGIAPGSEWSEYIAEHIDKAEAVIAFISDSAVNSANCRREITFALSRNKPFVSVFLEKTELPLGLELQLSAQQSVFKYKYDTEEAFWDKLCSTPAFEPCREEPAPVQAVTPEPAPKKETKTVQPSPPTSQTKELSDKPKKKKRPFLFAAIALAAVIVGIIAFVFVRNRMESDALNSGSAERYIIENVNVTRKTISVINRQKNIRQLQFMGCSFEDGVLADLAPGFEDNVWFEFHNCSGIDDLSFLSKYDSIYELIIKDCGLTDNVASDLSGLTVTSLNLSDNPDLTLVELNAQKLYIADLSNTKIANIDFLASAKQLIDLNLENTDVSDLSPIASLTNLVYLYLSGSKVDSFATELDSLGLTELTLHGCGLTSSDGLQDYVMLKKLDLGDNSLTDVSFLAKIAPNLTELDLSGNNVSGSDLAFLEDAVNLESLKIDHIDMSACQLSYLEKTPNLKVLSARDCKISDISGLSNRSGLIFIQLAFNEITDLSPFRKLVSVHDRVLDLTHNQIKDIAPLIARIGVLLIAENPITECSTIRVFLVGHCMIDYFEGLETSSLLSESLTKLYVLNCPREKQIEVKNKCRGSVVFCTREEQLEIIKSEYPELDYSGFEDMFLAE